MTPDFLMRHPKLVLVLKSNRYSENASVGPTLQPMANHAVAANSENTSVAEVQPFEPP